MHLLKPARLDVLPGQPDVVCADDGQPAGPAWLEYLFRKSHPIIRWLPSKLAAWIGENFGQELRIPHKRDLEWTAGELRQGPPPDGVHRRCREDQERACQREQDQGGRDE